VAEDFQPGIVMRVQPDRIGVRAGASGNACQDVAQ
jgi:hypothetical protein